MIRNRKRETRIAVVAMFTSIVLASACAGGANQRTAAPLSGKRWLLAELGGRAAIRTSSPRDAHLLFETDSARVGGSTGCNHLSGRFTLSGDSIRFGPTITTKMACVDTLIMQQETAFVSALDSTRRYELRGDTLVFLGAGGAVAKFLAAAP
jgi:heat shock protein HslJ